VYELLELHGNGEACGLARQADMSEMRGLHDWHAEG